MDFVCIGPSILASSSPTVKNNLPRLYMVECAHYQHGGYVMYSNCTALGERTRSVHAIVRHSIHRGIILQEHFLRWFKEKVAPLVNVSRQQPWLRSCDQDLDVGARTFLLAYVVQREPLHRNPDQTYGNRWTLFKGCYDGLDPARMPEGVDISRMTHRLRRKVLARCMWHVLRVYFCQGGLRLVERLVHIREQRSVLSLAHMDGAPHPTDPNQVVSLSPEEKLRAAVSDPNWARVAANKEMAKLTSAVTTKRVRESATWVNDDTFPGPKRLAVLCKHPRVSV